MNQTDSIESPAEIASTSWADAFIAPFRFLIKPADAARTMIGASRGAFWTFYCLGVAVFAVTVLFLFMWEASIDPAYEVFYMGVTPQITTTPAIDRSFRQVWFDWHAMGEVGYAEGIVVISSILIVAATLLAAWMLLPRVYGGGSAAAAYFRSFRAVASGFGYLWLLTLGWGSGLVVMINSQERWGGYSDLLPFVLMILLFAGILALLGWIGAAARGAAVVVDEGERSPRCEGCGYNLTHQPMEGLCPECGMAVADSLTEVRRPGARWQNVKTMGSWLESTARLIFKPRRFYGTLKMRTPREINHRFALFHYLMIGIGAFMWVAALITYEGGPGFIEILLLLIAMMLFPLLAWTFHRLIGALVASWLIVQGLTADSRSSETVICYEAAFLWVFCAYNGMLLTTLIAFGDWIDLIQKDLGIGWILGIPPAFLAIFSGNILLCALWLWRYQLAVKATRWSNF